MRGLEQARYQARRSFKRRIAEKETQNPAIIAKVGNGAGTVVVPGRPGWIYVRLHGDDNQLAEAKLGIPLDTGSLNDAWVRVKKASPRKASYYVVQEFITSSTGDPAPPMSAHPLDPDAGPHTGALTEDDVVFDDAAGHDHQGAGDTGKKVTAANVINVPAGGIVATDVQAAINELDAEKASTSHKDTHKSGGGDAFAATDLLEAIVKRLQESGGPTTLLMGAVADGQFLKRDGAGIVGAAAGGAHNILDGTVHPDSVAQAVTRGSLIYGNATPKWDELVIGAAARYLRSDGTDLAYAQIPASEVVNTPAGGIAATDVQAAINELDTEKAVKATYDAHDHSAGDPTQVNHANLTNILTGQHHAQAHTLASHSTKAHAELTGVTANLHHAQAHTLASHSTKAHSELTPIGEPFSDHPNNPRCRVRRTTAQSMPQGWASISFQSEQFDTDGIWTAGSPTRLTCKTPATYVIVGQAEYAVLNAGNRAIRIIINGGPTQIAVTNQLRIANWSAPMQVMTTIQLAVNNYVELQVYQDSGGNLSINATHDFTPRFSMVRVG